MWQRTQVIVKYTEKNWDVNVYAFHNQRGFGRPLVTWTLSIVLDALKATEDDDMGFSFTHERMRSALQRPFWLDEYFRWHKAYECSFPFSHNDHDNDDWYAEIEIDASTNSVDFRFYNYDWAELSALKYIVWEWCENYCNLEWKEWYIDTVKQIMERIDLPNNLTIKDAKSML